MQQIMDKFQYLEDEPTDDMTPEELLLSCITMQNIRTEVNQFLEGKRVERLVKALKDPALRDEFLGMAFAGEMDSTDDQLRSYGINPDKFKNGVRKDPSTKHELSDLLQQHRSVLYPVLLEIDPRARALADAINLEFDMDHP